MKTTFATLLAVSLVGMAAADAAPVRSGAEALGALADGIEASVLVQRRGGAVAVRGGAVGYRGGVAVRRTTVVRPGPVVRPVPVVRPGAVVVRPVRPWVARPYYGRIIGGVALGAVITAAAIGVAPAAPAPGLCWYWSDSGQTRGYWDYCR